MVELSALVVDVRQWVKVGKPQRVLVRAHHLAARLAIKARIRAVKTRDLRRHAALPGAVVLDVSIALLGNESSVLAADAGRRRRGDQPSGISTAASPPTMYCFMVPSFASPLAMNANAYVSGVCCN